MIPLKCDMCGANLQTVMNYEDGDIEQVEIKQLRGAKQGKKPAKKSGWFSFR